MARPTFGLTNIFLGLSRVLARPRSYNGGLIWSQNTKNPPKKPTSKSACQTSKYPGFFDWEGLLLEASSERGFWDTLWLTSAHGRGSHAEMFHAEMHLQSLSCCWWEGQGLLRTIPDNIFSQKRLFRKNGPTNTKKHPPRESPNSGSPIPHVWCTRFNKEWSDRGKKNKNSPQDSAPIQLTKTWSKPALNCAHGLTKVLFELCFPGMSDMDKHARNKLNSLTNVFLSESLANKNGNKATTGYPPSVTGIRYLLGLFDHSLLGLTTDTTTAVSAVFAPGQECSSELGGPESRNSLKILRIKSAFFVLNMCEAYWE